MSAPNREHGSFARAVEALSPYLDELVFVGGWAHYLYTVLPEAAPLGFEPLLTEDADIAAPLRVRVRGESIPALLSAAGFEHVPPVSEFALRDDPSGFYVEFIAPLVVGEVKRGGRVASTVSLGGTTGQLLRYVDLLLALPWKVRLAKELGPRPQADHDPDREPRFIRRPEGARAQESASFEAAEGRALPPRHLRRLRGRDAAGARRVGTRSVPAHVRTFQARAKGLAWEATDLARSAARIAADRPRPPTATVLQAVLQRGFREGFDVTR